MAQNPFEYNEVYEVHEPPLRFAPDNSAPVLQHVVCLGFMLVTLVTGLTALAALVGGPGIFEISFVLSVCSGVIAFGLHHDYRWSLGLTLVLAVAGVVWTVMQQHMQSTIALVALILIMCWLLRSHTLRRG